MDSENGAYLWTILMNYIKYYLYWGGGGNVCGGERLINSN